MNKKILIKGMMCNHCVKHVSDALNVVSGVASVEVSLKKKCAVVALSRRNRIKNKLNRTEIGFV